MIENGHGSVVQLWKEPQGVRTGGWATGVKAETPRVSSNFEVLWIQSPVTLSLLVEITGRKPVAPCEARCTADEGSEV
jgi:hypothetical protein